MLKSKTKSSFFYFVAEILYQVKRKKKKKMYISHLLKHQVIFLSKEASTWDIFWKYSTRFYS